MKCLCLLMLTMSSPLSAQADMGGATSNPCDRMINEATSIGNMKEALRCIQRNALPVGTVVASMLTPEEMHREYGPDWVLAQGQSELKSKFHSVTGDPNLPDLRGVFLRGMNERRDDGKQDPDREREVGSFQVNAYTRHDHRGTVKVHYHQGGGSPAVPSPVTEGVGSNTATFKVNANGNADETRPNNISVYYYIKIN